MRRRFQIWMILIWAAGTVGYNEQTFRAAVYEHAPLPPNRTIVVSRQDALQYMKGNLEAYKLVAEEAQRQVSLYISFTLLLVVLVDNSFTKETIIKRRHLTL